jgi:hypothetical protein
MPEGFQDKYLHVVLPQDVGERMTGHFCQEKITKEKNMGKISQMFSKDVWKIGRKMKNKFGK